MIASCLFNFVVLTCINVIMDNYTLGKCWQIVCYHLLAFLISKDSNVVQGKSASFLQDFLAEGVLTCLHSVVVVQQILNYYLWSLFSGLQRNRETIELECLAHLNPT